MENISINVTANCDCFIVPNALVTGDSAYHFDILEKIAIMNNVVYNKNTTKFVQLWLSSKELGSENLNDHGFFLKDPECCVRTAQYAPIELFIGKREGDIVDIVLPLSGTLMGHGPVSGQITLHATLAQSKYRYRQYGDFEYVLDRLRR